MTMSDRMLFKLNQDKLKVLSVKQKQTMTLNLFENEMKVLEELSNQADISKTAVIRQALRLYQLVHERIKAGETFHFSGDKDRQILFLGLGFGE